MKSWIGPRGQKTESVKYAFGKGVKSMLKMSTAQFSSFYQELEMYFPQNRTEDQLHLAGQEVRVHMEIFSDI